MTAPTSEQTVGHPSPHRHRVALSSLVFGLTAAPLAWLAASIASSTVAQEACFPGTTPLSAPAFGGVHMLLILSNVLACVVSIAGGLVAYGCWRRTAHEHPGRHQTLLEIGEGRARFMAMAGMLTSAGFLLATLFGVPAIAFVPLC